MGQRVDLDSAGGQLHRGMVVRLSARRARRFAVLLKQAGQIDNPDMIATRATLRTLQAALISVPAALLAALFVSPWLILLSLVPLAPYLSPELRLRDRVAERREGVERELPFFSVVVNVLASAGVPLYSILKDLANGDIFESMKKESLLVKRDVTIFGMNPTEALERLAYNHPSSRFGDFVTGYTSKVRSGGDVAMYLSNESAAMLRRLEDEWVRYVSRVGVVGSMMITAFGVVPLLLMVVGVFSPGFSIVGLALFAAIGVPLLTVSLLYLSGRMQPVRGEPIRGKAGMSALIAIPGVIVGAALGVVWVSVASALFVFCVAYGLSVREQLTETKAIEEGLAQFLKDLLEYKRQEYDLTKAVLALGATGKYNSRFKKILTRAAAQLKAGVPMDEIRVECRSRLGKITFLLLGQMSRSGGGTVDTVFQISSFADRMRDMRRNVAAEMKPYLVLSYLSPLLLAFGVTFVGGVLTSFSHTVRPGLSGVHINGFQIGVIPPGLSQVSDLLIVVSAASLGLIGAKITNFTVRNTIMASANVALAVGAIAATALLGSHSLTQLLGH